MRKILYRDKFFLKSCLAKKIHKKIYICIKEKNRRERERERERELG
jgi:hypothetical protein